MQIPSSTAPSALVQHRSTGSQADNNVSGINPTQATARDKQSENRRPATHTITNAESNSSVQNIPDLQRLRISAAKPVLNDAVASSTHSTHSTKMALQTFQQIDLMSEPELMHRVDALA